MYLYKRQLATEEKYSSYLLKNKIRYVYDQTFK